MEDPRISRMYLAMIERAAERRWERVRNGGWLRSSVTWIVLVAMVLVGIGVAIREKGRGHLQRLRNELGTSSGEASTATPQPGGEEPIIVSRAQRTIGIAPEFLSATLLPGRGMNVLQITAFLPGKGEVSLLDAPSLADAAQAMTGIEGDVNGGANLRMGGALEVPWAGQVAGAALPGRESILANWQGRGLTLPADAAGTAGVGEENTRAPISTGGLLLKTAAHAPFVPARAIEDGGTAEAGFDAGSFEGHWPSKTEVRTTVVLQAQTMELTVDVRNVGTEPEPMGIGWRPRFRIPAGDRARTRLRLPSTTRAATRDSETGLPTGSLVPVQGTPYDFASQGGAVLGTMSLNDSFVHLKNGSLKNEAMSTGVGAELRYPGAGYGLRLIALSPTIKAMRVVAPADRSTILIDPQTNYDDPFGREWGKDEDTGLVVLQPGESMQWRVRLEIFPVTGQPMEPVERLH